DLDRWSSERRHGVKTEFVREVIADENGFSSLEWRVAQIIDDRRALVASFRAQFQDPFPALQVPANDRRVRSVAAQRAMNERCKRRRAAIVDGESRAFVLEQQALVPRGEARHTL